jgi:hypothetical protein
MSALSPSLDAALAGDRAIVTLLLSVALPGRTMRLLAGGRGYVDWNGNRYSDMDAVFGTINSIDAIEDGDGDQAPALGFTMLPPNDVAAATLGAPGNQGSAVSVWLAGLHPVTGYLIPDPYLLFQGQIDQPIFRPGRQSREVAFECVSQFELLLEEDEGARLSDAFQKATWPGEDGFANVTGIENTIYWFTAMPNSTIATGNTAPPRRPVASHPL